MKTDEERDINVQHAVHEAYTKGYNWKKNKRDLSEKWAKKWQLVSLLGGFVTIGLQSATSC